MLDLLLTNARIVDGTGNPWRKGCVGVRDGRIVAVGSAHDMPEARTVLDIGGNILWCRCSRGAWGSASPRRA